MCAESSVAILSGDKEPLQLYITVTHKQLFVRAPGIANHAASTDWPRLKHRSVCGEALVPIKRLINEFAEDLTRRSVRVPPQVDIHPVQRLRDVVRASAEAVGLATPEKVGQLLDKDQKVAAAGGCNDLLAEGNYVQGGSLHVFLLKLKRAIVPTQPSPRRLKSKTTTKVEDECGKETFSPSKGASPRLLRGGVRVG